MAWQLRAFHAILEDLGSVPITLGEESNTFFWPLQTPTPTWQTYTYKYT